MDFSSGHIDLSALKRHTGFEKQLRQLARQIASKETFMMSTEEGNQYIASMVDKEMKKQAKSLEQRSAKDTPGQKETSIFSVEQADLPLNLEDLNPELDLQTLLILNSNISESDSNEEILKKVLDIYSDPSLADDALEYLEKVSIDTKLLRIKETRKEFNDKYAREIVAGKNISQEAREFAAQGLKNPNALRDLYRDITGKERSANQMFEEIFSQFEFEKLKKVIKFLLNALGRDLKSKGSSIPRALLYKLITDTRSLQAILAVYLFFKGRMKMLYRGFDTHDLYYPKQLSFELMAKLFMGLIEDRYPTPVKILKLSSKMGIDEEIVAQIIVLTQFRDAMRNVAPKLFKDVKHRQELLDAYIDALEELDEALEEEGEDE